MSKKQTLNLRQAGNNTIGIPLATLHHYSPSKMFAQWQSHPYSKVQSGKSYLPIYKHDSLHSGFEFD